MDFLSRRAESGVLVRFVSLFFYSLFFYSSYAEAGPFYIETGLGASVIKNGRALYQADTPSDVNPGFAGNLLLAKSFSHSSSLIGVHFGFSHRLNSSHKDELSFGTQATYVNLRLETRRFTLGGGWSPLVWKQYGNDSASGAGVGYSRAIGTQAYLAEFNLLWRIMPDLTISLGGAGEWFKSTAGLGPKPAASFFVSFRFYLPFTEERANSDRPDGWRYPFGVPLF